MMIFFNLEKAYDTMWKYGIMRDLHDLSLRGRLPLFKQTFSRETSGSCGIQNQEEVIPQGSIHSVTLFSMKYNNIAKCLNPKID